MNITFKASAIYKSLCLQMPQHQFLIFCLMLEFVGRGASHELLKLISIESVSFYFLFRSKNCNITTFEVLLLLVQ